MILVCNGGDKKQNTFATKEADTKRMQHLRQVIKSISNDRSRTRFFLFIQIHTFLCMLYFHLTHVWMVRTRDNYVFM